MIDILEVEDFLAHHGVRGQRWGIRKPKDLRTYKSHSGGQKAAIVGATVIGGLVGRHLTKHLSTPLKAIGVGGFALVGNRAVRLMLQSHGTKSVPRKKSSSGRVNTNFNQPKLTNQEAIQRTQQFLKTHPNG